MKKHHYNKQENHGMKLAMAFTAPEAPPVSHVIQFNRHDNC